MPTDANGLELFNLSFQPFVLRKEVITVPFQTVDFRHVLVGTFLL